MTTNELQQYVLTLTVADQQLYRDTIIASIESKFAIMDTLIAAFEAVKKDALLVS